MWGVHAHGSSVFGGCSKVFAMLDSDGSGTVEQREVAFPQSGQQCHAASRGVQVFRTWKAIDASEQEEHNTLIGMWKKFNRGADTAVTQLQWIDHWAGCNCTVVTAQFNCTVVTPFCLFGTLCIRQFLSDWFLVSAVVHEKGAHQCEIDLMVLLKNLKRQQSSDPLGLVYHQSRRNTN